MTVEKETFEQLADAGTQIDQFLISLIREYGGYEPLAGKMYECFRESEAGSSTRAKLLGNVVRLLFSRADFAVDYTRLDTESLEAEEEALRTGKPLKAERAKKGKIDVDVFLAHLIKKFGGHEGLAREVKQCTDDAGVGTNVQANVFAYMVAFLEKRTGIEMTDEFTEDEDEDAAMLMEEQLA